MIIIIIGISAESITVITRDHDWTREDGEVSHSVCSKREHPDEDLAVLTLCEPLMFSKGKYQFKRTSLFYN